MKVKNLILAGLMVAGIGTSLEAVEQEQLFGKKSPPRAAISSPEGINVAVLADIVKDLKGEDVDKTVDFINKLYELNGLFNKVVKKELELKQSHTSNEAQQALMVEYIKLLNDEKVAAKALIEVITADLEAHESRLLQVMAKIYRIGDRTMKQTTLNIKSEVKKFVRYRLMNAQGTDRQFYSDAMRFLDQYFR